MRCFIRIWVPDYQKEELQHIIKMMMELGELAWKDQSELNGVASTVASWYAKLRQMGFDNTTIRDVEKCVIRSKG